MSKTLHITADPTTVSMAASIHVAATAAPLFVLTVRALGELAAELGSMDAAARPARDSSRDPRRAAPAMAEALGSILSRGQLSP